MFKNDFVSGFSMSKKRRGSCVSLGVLLSALAWLEPESASAADTLTASISQKQCEGVSITFNRLATYNGRPVQEFHLYRNGTLVFRLFDRDVGAGSTGVISDSTFLPASNQTYSYQVVAYNSSGQSSPPSNTVKFTAAPALCGGDDVGPIIVLRVSPKSYSGSVVSKSRLDSTFGANGGLQSYFSEMSGGGWMPDVAVLSSTATLSKTLAEYQEQADRDNDYLLTVMKSELTAIKNKTLQDNPDLNVPGARLLFVVAGTTAGEHSGSLYRLGGETMRTGTLADRLGLLAHEIGHDLGLNHAGSVQRCVTNYPYLLDPTALPTGCDIAEYGGENPMGSVFGHYDAFSKWVLGYLPAPMTLTQADSAGRQRVRLYDSAWPGTIGGSTPIARARHVRFVLTKPDRETSYWIEYKTPRGFNDSTVTGAESQTLAGIRVEFIPGMEYAGAFAGKAQSLGVARTWENRAVSSKLTKTGDEVTLDQFTELKIHIDAINSDYADLTLTWKPKAFGGR